MNAKTYLKRRNVLDLFDMNSINGKQGYVKLWGSETGHCDDSHELTKFLICKKLRFEYGYEIWTEAVLKNGNGRVDILCIDKNGDGYILEVLHSESEIKLESKKGYYPDLPIYKIKTKDFDINNWNF